VKKFFHATHSSNVSKILSEGLTLPVGRVTSGSRTYPRIYLYKDVADAEEHIPALHALGSIPRAIPYATFQVNLPSSFKTYGDIEYRGAVFVTRSIPPKYLELVSTHSEDYTEFNSVDWDAPRKEEK